MKPPVLPGTTLIDIIGWPRFSAGFLFVPALLDFNEETTSDDELPWTDDGWRDRELQQVRYRWDPGGLESFHPLWIRARVARVFGFSRAGAGNDAQDSLLELPFIAIARGRRPSLIEACPLICIEGLYGPALLFSSSQRGSSKRLAIAEAFWALLLAEPFDLLPFDDHYYAEVEYDVMGTRKAGFDGWTFYDEDLNYSSHDGHLGFATGDYRRCPTCGGQGEEQFFASRERCDTCQGKGRVGWVRTSRCHESLAGYV